MYSKSELFGAIDLSLMALKICHLPESNRDRILNYMKDDVESFMENYQTASFPLFDRYMDLMEDSHAPDELKIAAFLYLVRSHCQLKKNHKGYESDEARTGEGPVVVEGTLARQTSD